MTHEDQLICYCFRVTEGEIIDAIKKYNLQNTDQVTRTIRAGGGCRTCRFDIDPLIEAYADRTQSPPPETELNEIQLYMHSEKILADANLQQELAEKGFRVALHSVEGTTLWLNFFSLSENQKPLSGVLSHLETVFRKKLHPHIQIQEQQDFS